MLFKPFFKLEDERFKAKLCDKEKSTFSNAFFSFKKLNSKSSKSHLNNVSAQVKMV